MVPLYCFSCGEELPKSAYFCPRCGARTKTGTEMRISDPWEDLRETFSRVGEEMEKAFSIAGKEMEKAFKTAREKLKEATKREPVNCPDCGEENIAGSRFCCKCGKKLK